MSTQTKGSVGVQAISPLNVFAVGDKKFGALELIVNGDIKQVIVAQLTQAGEKVPPNILPADEAIIREIYRKKSYRGPITFDNSAFYEIVD